MQILGIVGSQAKAPIVAEILVVAGGGSGARRAMGARDAVAMGAAGAIPRLPRLGGDRARVSRQPGLWV